MKRFIFEALCLALCFFGLFTLLSRVNYLGRFSGQKLGRNAEEKMGNLLYDFLRKQEKEVSQPAVTAALDTLLLHLTMAPDTGATPIRLHLFHSTTVNAFALPGQQIVVTTEMIRFCKCPEELAGVLAHEQAHIVLNHVTERVVKEIGVSLLSTLVSGRSDNQILGEIVHLLAGTAFDRKQERQADSAAVQTLMTAGVDPEPFANLLFRLTHETPSVPEQFEWISTHPETKERVSAILGWKKSSGNKSRPLLTPEAWDALKRSDAAGASNL